MDTAAKTAARALWHGEFRATLALAWPMVGSNLLQMAVYAIDVMFVARLSKVEFAAATLGVFLISVIQWALLGLVTASAPLIAAERGRRTHAVREVRYTVRMALWLSVLASLPFLVLLAHGDWLLTQAGQDPQVAARAGDFLRILLFALIPGLVVGALRTAASALECPRWAMLIACLGLLIGLTTNWLLVFGHGGFPALGLEGAALASVITATLMMLAFGLVFFLDRRLKRYRLFGYWWQPKWQRMGDIVQLGAPIALAWTMEGALFGGAAMLMGLIGVSEVAAHAVALNIAALAFQIPLGVAQATTIRVGLAFGARQGGAVARAGWAGIALGTGVMLVTALAIWIAPRLLIGIYLDPLAPQNAQVVSLAVQYLFVAALFQLFDGAQAVTGGALRGLQDTRVPMLIAAFGFWVAGFGTALALGFWTPLQGQGIWIGLAAGLAVTSALLLRRWMRREALGLVAPL
jgi:putative MATE family efflux protein